MGPDGSRAVARSAGGDDVQSLDLPASETTRGPAADGPCGADESHQRGEEEKRQDRRTHHCRSAALQPVSGMFRYCARAGGVTTADAVPATDDRTGSNVEEQNGGTADGSWGGIRAAPSTREALFR